MSDQPPEPSGDRPADGPRPDPWGNLPPTEPPTGPVPSVSSPTPPPASAPPPPNAPPPAPAAPPRPPQAAPAPPQAPPPPQAAPPPPPPPPPAPAEEGRYWLASDGRWYPPTARPGPTPPPGPPPAYAPTPGAPAYGATPYPQTQPQGAYGQAPPGAAYGSAPYGSAPYGSAPYGSAPYGYPPQGAVPYGYVPATLLKPATVSGALSGWLQALFWAVAGLSAIVAVLALRALAEFDGYANGTAGFRLGNYRSWIDADNAFLSLRGFTAVVFLAGFVLLIIWTHKGSKASSRLAPTERRWSSGWAVGAWFIPIANFLFPKFVLDETEKLVDSPREGGRAVRWWKSTPTSAVGWAWWVLLVLGSILTLVGMGMRGDGTAVPAKGVLDTSYGLVTFGYLSYAAGCVFGAFYVRKISRKLSPRALADAPW